MFKNFVLKKLVEKQMKDLPKDQQEKILRLIQEHPELFQKIAAEIQSKTAQGKNQMQATMEVMKTHEAELRCIMS